MTGVNRDISFGKNIFSSTGATGNCLLCVEDYSGQHTAEQMRVTSDGNLYHRATAASPRWTAVWSNSSAGLSTYEKLATFVADASRDHLSREITGGDVLTATHQPTATVASVQREVARPMPADVALLAGVQRGTVRLDALRPRPPTGVGRTNEQERRDDDGDGIPDVYQKD
jgi:hypothetical protein